MCPEEVAALEAEPEQSSNLEIDRNKCLSAGKRMSSGGELPSNELMSLLSLAGQKRGDQSWVDELMEQHFCGRSTVDREDFWQFVDLYEAKFLNFLDTEFKKADEDDSGVLSPPEMAHLLRKLGFTPAPWTVQELMLELASVKTNVSRKDLCRASVQNAMGGLDLDQFMKLNDLLLQRAGFTKSEVMQFVAIFKRYDRSGDGEIDTKELQTALAWSGFSFTEDTLETMIVEVDRDKSGTIDQGDFLTLMRKHREIEIDTLKSAFSASDVDQSGTLDIEELPRVFEELAYKAALPAVFKDGIKACGLMPSNEGEYLFEDVWILLDWFRDRDGFSDAELKEIAETFSKHDRYETGQLKAMYLGNAIRWMGYPQTFDELMDVIEEFEIDDDEGVNLSEFQKIMRYYREQEVNRVRTKFSERDADGSGSLSQAELKQVLLHLGYTPAAKELKKMFQDLVGGESHHSDEVGLWELEALVRGFKLEARVNFRKNHGFTEQQVLKYTHEFEKHDPQKDGFVDNKDLRRMLTRLFPNANQDANAAKKVRDVLAQIEGDGSDGKLDFDEYLRLMRLLQDEVELKKLDREKTLVKESKYSRKEVSDFRSIFQSFDSDHSGEMSFDEFLVLLSAILPPEIVNGAKMRPQLHSMFEGVQGVAESGEKYLDFPGFLLIMRRIQDEDLGGINEILAEQGSASP
jgi:Ca2+-binding EF-hand superfamily protein